MFSQENQKGARKLESSRPRRITYRMCVIESLLVFFFAFIFATLFVLYCIQL